MGRGQLMGLSGPDGMWVACGSGRNDIGRRFLPAPEKILNLVICRLVSGKCNWRDYSGAEV